MEGDRLASEYDRDSRSKKDRTRKTKNLNPWLIGIILIFILFIVLLEGGLSGGRRKIGSSELVEKALSGEVAEVSIIEGTGRAHAVLKSDLGKKHPVNLHSPQVVAQVVAELKEADPTVAVSYRKAGFLQSVLPYFLPFLLIILLFYFLFVRQLRSPGVGGSVLSFGKSRAKLAGKGDERVTFDDVAGVDEAKEEVQEIIEFLKHPAKFQRLGGRVPRGVLLVGAPGTGKTLLAKAIAGEANVPFFTISGSDFVEMFVGVGASRVRDLFKQARESSPCIVFLDEVDAVGRRRGSGLGGGHDEREQTLNAILVEMDGFDSGEGVILIASTNRPDVLDPALLRPGRFDRQILVDLPDLKGREQIIRVHVRNVKLAPDVDIPVLARGTPSFSGAEIEAMVNEGAILAAMKEKEAVGMDDLEESRDKVRWGRQKRSRAMEETDRRVTAYHEAGHALMTHLLPEVEPLHKVTIIPRGMALGATMQLPERDRYHLQKKTILGNIKVLYGGRVAEKIACKDITSGAKNDIERATDLARSMVCEWGMSDALGPISYSENEETLFLGREITRSRNHSEATARAIDEEVKTILTESFERTEEMIQEHRDALKNVAEALLAHEVLSGAEVSRILKGEAIETIKRGAPARGRSRPAAAGAEPEPRGEVEGEERLDDGLAGAKGSEAVS